MRHLLFCAGVGALAGLVGAHIRLGLGLPGHKALCWMVPVLAARLLGRSSLGATAGSMTAFSATLATGGHLAGAAVAAPLIGVAGLVLDTAAGFVQRRRLPALAAIPLLGLAGMLANLVMLAKRLSGPLWASHEVAGLAVRLLSYAAFGLAAGVGAALLAMVLARAARRPARPTTIQ